MLKNFRLEKGLTQRKLAKMLNVQEYTIGDWERGRSEPSVDDIKKLCIIFDVSSDELLEIETERQRKQIKINNSFNGNNGKIDLKF